MSLASHEEGSKNMLGKSARLRALSTSALVATATLVVQPSSAFGQTSTWNVGTGFWNVAGNWLPSAIPPAGNVVRIVHGDATDRIVTFNFDYPTTPLNSLLLDNTGTGTNTLGISAFRFATSGNQ